MVASHAMRGQGRRSAASAGALLVLLGVSGALVACESPLAKKGPKASVYVAQVEAACAPGVTAALANSSVPLTNDVEGIEAQRTTVRAARATLLDLSSKDAPAAQASAFKAFWVADITILDNRLEALRSTQAADIPGVTFAGKARVGLVKNARASGRALGLSACLPKA